MTTATQILDEGFDPANHTPKTRPVSAATAKFFMPDQNIKGVQEAMENMLSDGGCSPDFIVDGFTTKSKIISHDIHPKGLAPFLYFTHPATETQSERVEMVQWREGRHIPSMSDFSLMNSMRKAEFKMTIKSIDGVKKTADIFHDVPTYAMTSFIFKSVGKGTQAEIRRTHFSNRVPALSVISSQGVATGAFNNAAKVALEKMLSGHQWDPGIEKDNDLEITAVAPDQFEHAR